MKKLITAAAASTLLLTGAANADTIGFEVGASYWQTDLDDGTSTKYDSNGSTTIYGLLEHPIPVLPNIKVVLNTVEHDVDGGSTKFTADSSFNDFILYYEVLDNIVELDLGFGARQYTGQLDIPSALNVEAELDPILATVYGKVKVNLPLSGLHVGAELLLGKASDSDTTDATAYLGWESSVGVGIRGGYRVVNSEIELGDVSATTAGASTTLSFDSVTADVDGAFITAYYHF